MHLSVPVLYIFFLPSVAWLSTRLVVWQGAIGNDQRTQSCGPLDRTRHVELDSHFNLPPPAHIMSRGLLLAVIAAISVFSAINLSDAAATCSAIEDNTDYAGNDIAQTTQASASNCCTDCGNTPGCKAFSWEAGTCYLKSQPSNKVSTPGSRAAIVNLPAATCSAILENTDLPGNDIGDPLQLPTVGLCCTFCANTNGCIAYVWVLRNNVGTCLLKSSKGTPSSYQGARAAYLDSSITPPPTPSPPPSGTCGVVERDVDYPFNDIISTQRSNYNDCCADCQATPGCSLYVWGSTDGGTCFLKSKKGDRVSSPGARTADLTVTGPITPLPNVQSAVYGTNPLPTIAYNYISAAQWIDQSIMTAVISQVERFEAANLANNFSHATGPFQVFALESVIDMNVYINVTSQGECATLTAAYGNNFFTYWPQHLYCLVHINSMASSLQMLTASGVAIVYPQNSDPAFVASTVANVATNADCVTACATKRNCAGVEYSSANRNCVLYQPRASTFPDVSAGWVYNPISNVDNAGVQYSQMTLAALPNTYIKESIPGVASLQACASSAKSKSYTLFAFNSATRVCVYYAPTPSPTKALSLVNTPLVAVVLSGTFGADVASGAMAASTAADCYKLCVPSQNLCFASVFDSASNTCTYVKPSFDASSTLGWIIPKTLPDSMATVSQVDFYVTAHQDDHELFMSAPIYYSIKSPTTKSVFVYMSAGDASRTDGWWQARETGTLAASKTWVNIFGLYSPVSVSSTVLFNGHHIQKIVVGNTVHYFLRLSEANLELVLNKNQQKAPLDQPNEPYANAQAVKNVLKSIIVAEATKVAKVTASYSNYLIDPSEDHVLHVATGRVTAELLNADSLFKTCVSQTPFFGYQYWLDAVNMKDPEKISQRAVWLGLGVGIFNQHGDQTWSDHSPALGRTYTGNAVIKTAACAF
ncbi:hypothetical protein DYB36_009541 [Aphanomyces astaci]|uniref:Apple domain-containing protein n=1 Tax=Aphanomyces astaci TaxID=112090 RepID=A0A397A4C7_APHAT|nr:hypothetical protein DYB36_009541 [Aphanomyces astaci]